MKRKTLIGAALIPVGVAILGGYVLVGRGFSALEKPTAVEAFLARRVRYLATPRGARKLANPLKVSPLLLAEGRDHFADHCAICHANDGSGKTQIGSGLYPPAPDMRDAESQGLTDGELLYIIKNGIRFTGMPGWGGEDRENWQLVLFIRHLPQLSAEERALMEDVNGIKQ